MNFDEMIGSNKVEKKTTKKAKKSAEIISVPSHVQDKIDSLLEAKKAKKVAESDIKKAEPTIIDHGIEMKDKNAFSGKFQKSYKIGNEDNHVNFVTYNKWSFKQEDVPFIKEIIEYGEGKPEEFLNENTEVKLKAEVFKDEDLKKKFVKMVGKAFPEFFETVVSHSVAEDFDKKIYDLGEYVFENLQVYMTQSKPSLR